MPWPMLFPSTEATNRNVLKDEGIPIYHIHLNFEGYVDTEILKNILFRKSIYSKTSYFPQKIGRRGEVAFIF